MEKNNNYMENLKLQFMQAKGYTNIDAYIIDEFNTWLDKLTNRKENFIRILKYLGCDYKSLKSAEIGKGAVDTIVKPGDKTYLITPYTLDNPNYNVLKGYFNFSDRPYVMKNNPIIADAKKIPI